MSTSSICSVLSFVEIHLNYPAIQACPGSSPVATHAGSEDGSGTSGSDEVGSWAIDRSGHDGNPMGGEEPEHAVNMDEDVVGGDLF